MCCEGVSKISVRFSRVSEEGYLHKYKKEQSVKGLDRIKWRRKGNVKSIFSSPLTSAFLDLGVLRNRLGLTLLTSLLLRLSGLDRVTPLTFLGLQFADCGTWQLP